MADPIPAELKAALDAMTAAYQGVQSRNVALSLDLTNERLKSQSLAADLSLAKARIAELEKPAPAPIPVLAWSNTGTLGVSNLPANHDVLVQAWDVTSNTMAVWGGVVNASGEHPHNLTQLQAGHKFILMATLRQLQGDKVTFPGLKVTLEIERPKEGTKPVEPTVPATPAGDWATVKNTNEFQNARDAKRTRIWCAPGDYTPTKDIDLKGVTLAGAGWDKTRFFTNASLRLMGNAAIVGIQFSGDKFSVEPQGKNNAVLACRFWKLNGNAIYGVPGKSASIRADGFVVADNEFEDCGLEGNHSFYMVCPVADILSAFNIDRQDKIKVMKADMAHKFRTRPDVEGTMERVRWIGNVCEDTTGYENAFGCEAWSQKDGEEGPYNVDLKKRPMIDWVVVGNTYPSGRAAQILDSLNLRYHGDVKVPSSRNTNAKKLTDAEAAKVIADTRAEVDALRAKLTEGMPK